MPHANAMRAVLPLLLSTISLTCAAANAANTAAPDKLNVLLIVVDDLRPELGCYGVPEIKTPNIDRLADRGITFSRAYCQQAVCSPSRTSFLTGCRPDTTKVYDLRTQFRRNLPDVVTLPQHFKNHGYHAQGLSKIFHPGVEDPASWSVPHVTPRAPTYAKPETVADLNRRKEERRVEIGSARNAGKAWDWRTLGEKRYVMGPAWEDPDVPDNVLVDGKTTELAVDALRNRPKNKPFFLAVGYLKPHLPFVAPKKYYDLYRRDELRLAANPHQPKDCPPFAAISLGELENYFGIPNRLPVSTETALDLIHGYYAATSFTDAQVGKLLDELDRLDLAGNTVVCLLGDHGWQAWRARPMVQTYQLRGRHAVAVDLRRAWPE